MAELVGTGEGAPLEMAPMAVPAMAASRITVMPTPMVKYLNSPILAQPLGAYRRRRCFICHHQLRSPARRRVTRVQACLHQGVPASPAGGASHLDERIVAVHRGVQRGRLRCCQTWRRAA